MKFKAGDLCYWGHDISGNTLLQITKTGNGTYYYKYLRNPDVSCIGIEYRIPLTLGNNSWILWEIHLINKILKSYE